MENLHKIEKLKLLCGFILFTSFIGYCQDNYLVYKTEGAPYLEINDSIKSISKGSLISKQATLKLGSNDAIYFLDNEQKMYLFKKQGTFKYKDLKKVEPSEDKSTFTQNMFRYVWNQFTRTDLKEKNKSGVVYRGDDIVLMRHPADSIRIFYPEIKFEWDSVEGKTKDYYFILRDVENQQISKVGIKSNSITLFANEGLLTSGKMYEWTITETKFPNYDKTTFYSFKLLTTSEFDALKKEIDAITKDLKSLGLDKNEIRAAICEDYKVCY